MYNPEIRSLQLSFISLSVIMRLRLETALEMIYQANGYIKVIAKTITAVKAWAKLNSEICLRDSVWYQSTCQQNKQQDGEINQSFVYNL